MVHLRCSQQSPVASWSRIQAVIYREFMYSPTVVGRFQADKSFKADQNSYVGATAFLNPGDGPSESVPVQGSKQSDAFSAFWYPA